MHGEQVQRLAAAKQERDHAITRERETADALTLATVEADGWVANVALVEHERAALIAAGKLDAVLIADAELVRARVSAEIATTRAAAALAAHAQAATALDAATGAIHTAARAVLDAELIDLADQFTQAFDAALALGARLQALSGTDPLNQPVHMAARALPPAVTAALARLPLPDLFNTPISALRGIQTTNGRARRLAELATA